MCMLIVIRRQTSKLVRPGALVSAAGNVYSSLGIFEFARSVFTVLGAVMLYLMIFICKRKR